MIVRGGHRARFVALTTFALFVALVTIILFVRGGLASATEAPVSALGITAPNTPPDLVGVVVSEHTVAGPGVPRTYRAVVPAGAAAATAATGRLPLLIVLSGRGEGSWTAARTTGFLPLAQRGAAVLVYPDALGRSWNAGGGCCGVAGRTGTQDTDFIAAVTTDATATLPVDAARVYLAGYSNGGKLAYTVSCVDPQRYAGVATYGAVPLAPCPGAEPIPFLMAAGVRDAILPFNGAPRAHPPTAAVRPAAAGLAARDRCTGPATTSRAGSANSSNFTDCADGTGVELLVFPFYDHAWPPTLAGSIWSYLTGFSPGITAPGITAPATRSPVEPPIVPA